MLEFSANEYLKVISALERLTAIFEVRTADMLELASGQKGNIIKPFRDFIEYAERMKLSHSGAFARETLRRIMNSPSVLTLDSGSGSPMKPNELHSEIKALGRIFRDEIDTYKFMFVPPEKQSFYDDQQLFGEEVNNNFPSAIIDIEEAGKCFALSRSTASVFHLMRVVEIGLMAFAQGLGIVGSIKTAQPSWGRVLSLTNTEIQNQNRSPSSSWTAEKRGVFENIQADLMAVKNAWRNPTMHVENIYDEERARDVFNAVRGFMRHLAHHLDESGTFTP